MTVSIAAGWVIAIVIVIALFGWLTVVLRADTHPGWKYQSKLPKYEVTGGAFEAQDGGRQLMPRHGGRPMPTEEELASGSIPAQRAAAEKEELARAGRIPAQRATAEREAAAATSGQRADEPHLVAGSKLRLAAGVSGLPWLCPSGPVGGPDRLATLSHAADLGHAADNAALS